MSDKYRIERWTGEGKPSAGQLIDILENDGYSVFGWSDAPGITYAKHSHGEDQSHFIVSGRLELEVEGVGRIELGPGDRDLMPAGTVHSAKVIGSEPVVYLIGRKL